ncbi:MAG TPA: trigger factor [Gammaproteobacteria bacterium]|nr:trigger factor [Gammaproteobacteria bacterium]
MQVSVESTSNIERKMTVELPAEKVDSEFEARLRSVAPRVQLKGFRPGKVPMKVVRQQYGKSVFQEVVGELVQSSFQEAVSQENLKPAGAPVIDELDPKPGAELKYIATFEVYPEIEIKDLSDQEITQPEVEVTEDAVDKMVETLREQNREWVDVERAAAEGDQVTIDFEGFVDDEAFEGGKAADVPVEIGKGAMIPGFEEQLVGVKAGEEKTLEVDFPEDYHAENLAGKKARFEVKVKAVKEARLPELDEAFVKKFGVEDGSLETFREDVKNNMVREADQAVRRKVKSDVMAMLMEVHDVEAPKALVKGEVDALRRQAMANTGQRDGSMFPDELFEEEANRRVVLGLIVSQIIRDNDIQLDQDRVEVALDEMAETYEEPEALKQYYRTSRERMASLEAMVIEEQVVDWVKSQVQVTAKQMSFDEIMNPAKATGEAEANPED